MTLLRTAVERASCGVHKLFRTGVVPKSLTFIVMAVANGLFGLYRSERADESFISTPSPPFHVHSKPYGFCGRNVPCLLT